MNSLGPPDPDFEERLAYYSEVVAAERAATPDTGSPLLDQIGAAADEMREAFALATPRIEEAFEAKAQSRTDIPDEIYAYMLAALHADDMLYCRHSGTPQPLFAFLTQRMIACRACTQFIPREVDPDDDSCDFCRRIGVPLFTPRITMIGAVTVIGESCAACDERLTLHD